MIDAAFCVVVALLFAAVEIVTTDEATSINPVSHVFIDDDMTVSGTMYVSYVNIGVVSCSDHL
jgi:hypothetical protein